MEKVFRALADRNRLRIIMLLETGALNVSELISVLRLTQSNVSHHLKVLLNAGIVRRSGRANWAFYSTVKDNPVVAGLIDTAFRNRLNYSEFRDDVTRLAGCYAQRREEAVRFFDSVGEKNWRELSGDLPDSSEYLPFVADVFSSAELVLEVGTGQGRMIPFLLSLADRVLAVDNSRLMLEHARSFIELEKIGNRVDLRLGDSEHLPVGDEAVDGVFMHMLLHHVPSPEQAIREAARVLRPNGVLLIVDFTEHSDFAFKQKQGDLWPGFTLGRLKKSMQSAGFTFLKEDVFNRNRVLVTAGVKGVGR